MNNCPLPGMVFCPRCKGAHKGASGVIGFFDPDSRKLFNEEDYLKKVCSDSRDGKITISLRGYFCSKKCWRLFLKNWEASNGAK